MSRRILLSVLIACLATIHGCWETPESHYADRATAVRDGAIVRGWIPKWIPASATEIKEVHDIDTNEVWLAFHAMKAELVALETHCAIMTTPPEEYPLRMRSWWPPHLSRNGPAQSGKFRFLNCSDGVLALDLDAHQAYYWGV